MKSLQNQYNLIKEGKGNKEIFLKEAKAQFPQYITNVQTFDQVIHSLTEKGIISETLMLGGIAQPTTPNWFKIFNENVKAELKETDETVEEMETKGYNYKEKNNNNISTAEMLKGYYAEMKDPKNAEKTEDQIKAIVVKNLEKDSLYYVKDGAFGIKGLGYKEDHPGLGPTKEVTGKYKSSGMEPVKLNESLEEDKVPGSNIKKVGDKWRIVSGKTGKMWKAHYDTKEDAEAGLKAYFASQNESITEDEYKRKMLPNKVKGIADTINIKSSLEKLAPEVWGEADFEKAKEKFIAFVNSSAINSNSKKQMLFNLSIINNKRKLDQYLANSLLNFEKLGVREGLSDEEDVREITPKHETLAEAKKGAIEKHIAEIEKMGEVAAWEHKIGKIQEKIEELTDKMTMAEGDDIKEYVNTKAVNELKRNIKLLEKKKALYEKQRVKAAKRLKDKSMMEDTALENNPVLEVDATSMPTAAMMLQMADNNPERFKEYVKQINTDPAFKTQFMKKLNPAEKEELTKKIEAHSKTKKESWSGMVRELINAKNLKLK